MFDKQQNGAGSAEGFDSDEGDIWKRSTNAIKAAESEAQPAPEAAADQAATPAAEAQSPANRIDRVARNAATGPTATGPAAPEGAPEAPPAVQPPMAEAPAQPAPVAAPEPAPQPEPVASPAPPPAPDAEAAPPAQQPAQQPTGQPEMAPAPAPEPATAEPAAAETSAPETTAPGQILTVGRGIRLVAKACECDGLTVEGHLEATAQARTLTVAKGGSFIGSAEVASAEIHGTFEGNLTVSERLTIHSTGSVSGTTRYQEITIDAGGQISGNTQCLAGAPKTGG